MFEIKNKKVDIGCKSYFITDIATNHDEEHFTITDAEVLHPSPKGALQSDEFKLFFKKPSIQLISVAEHGTRLSFYVA